MYNGGSIIGSFVGIHTTLDSGCKRTAKMVFSLQTRERDRASEAPLLGKAKGVVKVIMVQMIENMKKGYQAGNELVKEILALKVVSKYRMAKDLGVNRQTVYNWIYGYHSPDEAHYTRLKDYRLFVDKLRMVGRFQ